MHWSTGCSDESPAVGGFAHGGGSMEIQPDVANSQGDDEGLDLIDDLLGQEPETPPRTGPEPRAADGP
jgi:hypothetical protein